MDVPNRELFPWKSTNAMRIVSAQSEKSISSSPLFFRQLQDQYHRGSGPAINIHDIYVRRLSYSQPSEPKPENIPCTRILNAPGLEDDYYLNVLDWSHEHNHIALGLGSELYLWNAVSEEALLLARLSGEDRVSAVAWQGNYLAVGTRLGNLEVFDVDTRQRVLTRKVHAGRVSVLAWQGGGSDRTWQLSSGSRDRSLAHYDLRDHRLIRGRICQAHEQEICGLKWNSEGEVLASGGNDNRLHLWDARRAYRAMASGLEHQAAVKALAWASHRSGFLASGGGTADRTIRLWDVRCQDSDASADNPTILTSAQVINTNAQVCSLLWSRGEANTGHFNRNNRSEGQLISAHGYSEHLVLRWSATSANSMPSGQVRTSPMMKLTGVMRGHERRVLYMAAAPDNKTIVTGGADQTLRFWPAFATNPKEIGKEKRWRRPGRCV